MRVLVPTRCLEAVCMLKLSTSMSRRRGTFSPKARQTNPFINEINGREAPLLLSLILEFACEIIQSKVFSQPIFGFVESWCSKRWPNNTLITSEIPVDVPGYGIYHINLFRLIWRTVYVIVTVVIAMILPFFNDFLGLIGAASFWPLTVYFPVEMYIARMNMRKFSFTWTWLKILSWACLVVSLVAAAGSVQGLIQSLKTHKPFKTQ